MYSALQIILFCLIFSQVSAEENIYLFAEIQEIRSVAIQSVVQAHREGGKLFRSTLVDSPEGHAYETFKWRVSYTHYTDAFNHFLGYCHPKGIDHLYKGYEHITDIFFNFYTGCIAKNDSLQAHYERGKIFFNRGIYEDAIDDIKPLIDHSIQQFPYVIGTQKEEFLLIKGQIEFESGAYDKAIDTLTDLIKNDPKNKEAYFTRALAYFETGNFDRAISDYNASGKRKSITKISPNVSIEFSQSLMSGLIDGGKEAILDFIPSLCSSIYGLGTCTWAFAQHPIDSTINFCNACEQMAKVTAKYFKTLDGEKVEGYVHEIKLLCEQFDQLKDAEKGRQIGYCIGRYGVDIFAINKFMKGVEAFKKLKNANRICSLEAMTLSLADKEALIASALKHKAEREAYFKNVKIHWDKQRKHILGSHNFIEGGGIITLNPLEFEKLVKEYVGKGQKVTGEFGMANYKERVDFGVIIGEYALKIEGKPIQFFPTSKGIITHAKDGTVHVYPTNPKASIH